MNALNHWWYELSLLPQAAMKHVVSRDFILKKSVHGTSPVSYQEQEIFITLFHIRMSICMSFCITFKKETSACGSQVGRHMWITSGSFCGSVSQVDQHMWPTFSPAVFISQCKVNLELSINSFISVNTSSNPPDN